MKALNNNWIEYTKAVIKGETNNIHKIIEDIRKELAKMEKI